MRNELRHTLELGVGTGLSSLFRIAFVVIAGRILGPAEYADFYTALSIASLFAAATAPIAGTITRFVSLYAAKDQAARILELRTRLPRYVRLSAIGLSLLGIIAIRPAMHWLHFESVLTPLLVAIIVPLNLLIDMPRGFLRGLQMFRSYGASLAIESALRLALCLVAFQALAHNAPSGLGAQALATLVVLGLTHQLLRRSGGEVDRPVSPSMSRSVDLRELATFTLPLFAFAVLVALFQNADTLLVKALFGAVEAGQFGAVNAISKLIWLIFLPFGILSLPLLTAEFSAGRSVWPALFRTLAGFLGLAAVALLALDLFGVTLLESLYGPAFLPEAPILIPLTLSVALSATSVLIGQAFAAMNRFGFLILYSAGLLVQLAWMYTVRDSILKVVYAVVGSQSAIVVGMLLLLFFVGRSTRTTAAGEGFGR